MSEATEKLSVSIVLAGQFNPSILSPAWFQKTQLVSDEEVAAARVSVIHPEVAAFSVGGYTLDVRTNRFSIQVESEPVIRVLDAAESLFGILLPHSPIQQYGLNYQEHFMLDSAARRIALGRALAPLEPWGAWGAEIASLTGERTSGMSAIVMREMYADGKSSRRVEVQPSVEVEPITSGVFIAVNDHNVVAENEDTVPAGEVIELIRGRFDESVTQARKIVDDVYEFARQLRSA